MNRITFCPSSLVLSFVLFLSGCATLYQLPPSENNRIIVDVPFYAQEKYQCGPASLAGVMNYWGVNITPDIIAEEIYSKSAKGTPDFDVILYPEKKGLVSERYQGNMYDLRRNIDEGYPLIVLVDYGIWVLQENHFMVIIGYNEHGVIVNSGKEKEKFIPKEDFVKAWERTKFWTLLLKRK
ncbi:MAG: peptidase C39 family protein [Nitrospirae bacterium]|nr:peptidase C39 family protein [Nitrospirota bacterium]